MKYHNISHCDQKNGNGIRVVLFVAGCSHHCKGCQNPITHDPHGGIFFDEEAKSELFEAMNNPWITGITFSGGDPLYESNLPEVEALIDEIREHFPQKDIWIYSGYRFEELIDDLGNPINKRGKIISKCDVFVDGKYEESMKRVSAHWVGSSNQRVIDIPKSMRMTKQNGKWKICLWEESTNLTKGEENAI